MVDFKYFGLLVEEEDVEEDWLRLSIVMLVVDLEERLYFTVVFTVAFSWGKFRLVDRTKNDVKDECGCPRQICSPTFTPTYAFYIQKANNHVVSSSTIYLRVLYCHTYKSVIKYTESCIPNNRNSSSGLNGYSCPAEAGVWT